MNWRDLIVGAILTLIVSTVAGVLVWYLTLDPRQNAEEQLIFYKDSVVMLGDSSSRIGVFSVRYANKGKKSAEEIKSVLSFNSEIDILEIQVTSSAGQPVGLIISSPDSKTVVFSISSLAPDEVITETILLRGIKPSDPSVSFRNKASIGKLGLITDQDAPEGPAKKFAIIAAAMIASILLNFFGSRYIDLPFKKILAGVRMSRNDIAFTLIQEKNS